MDTVAARPHAAQPSEAQNQLIDDLGGPTAVARIIEDRLGFRLTPQAISNWERRGIPYRYRGALCRAAGERGIAVPPDFLIGEAVKPTGDLPAFLQPEQGGGA